MIDRRMVTLLALLAAGCGTGMTAEQKMVQEIFLDVAYQCESRYHTIHVDSVSPDGGLQIHADADSRTEYRPFVAAMSRA